MSEKQLMKAEELLDLITSPGSRSQEEVPLEVTIRALEKREYLMIIGEFFFSHRNHIL